MHESLNLKAHYSGSFANCSCNPRKPLKAVKKQALLFKEAQFRLSSPHRDLSSLEVDTGENRILKRRFKRLTRVTAIQSQPLTSQRPWRVWEHESLQPRQFQRHCVSQPRNTPPKRDTGIASEKEWGINLETGKVNESGVNEDGSSWYQEGGEDLGENGYRCRWTVMGGKSAEGSCEWREAWWEKSDWTGYKELGAEKSGKNAQGDSWWETWQEILRQDEWSNLARIERNAQKQAQSGNRAASWYEKWWEKYNAKGWTEKGAHKYGRLNEQSWWEKWGEQYDGRGAVLKWTDKWAETEMGTKWGDKWEEKFFSGMGAKQGETWHSSSMERWSRTWGEEHFGNGTVRKYGRSTSGESWDTLVEEGTYYESEPHYGWADAIGNSAQLLAIEMREKQPGVYPDLDFGIPSKSGQASPTHPSQFQDLSSPPIPPSPPSPPPRPIFSPIPPPPPPPTPPPPSSPSPSPPSPPPPPFLEE